MAPKRYSIVLADRSTGVLHRLTISLRPTVTAIAVLFAIPVLVGLGARWSARAAIAELERSNVALRMENASYREATGALAAQISSLQAAVDALGVQAAVDPAARRAMDKLPAVVKSRAMGGEPATGLAGPMLGGAFGAPENTFSVLRDVLGALESSLDIVRNGVERRHALAAATPSIWPVTGWLSSSYGSPARPVHRRRGFPSRPRHLRRLWRTGPRDSRRCRGQRRRQRRTTATSSSSSTATGSRPATDTFRDSPRHRPAGPSRRHRRLCRFDRPVDERAPPLRDPASNGQLTNPLKLLTEPLDIPVTGERKRAGLLPFSRPALLQSMDILIRFAPDDC